MLRAFFMILGTTLLASIAMAEPSKVQCTLDHDGRKEWVQLKLDESGKIIQWDDERWAKPSEQAYWFSIFGENIEEYGFEWGKSFKAPNGYSILELGTTADAFKIGVNLEASKGFFQYQDHGSGAGDLGPLQTNCSRL